MLKSPYLLYWWCVKCGWFIIPCSCSMRKDSVNKLLINRHTNTKLTFCIDEMLVVDSQSHQKSEAWEKNCFTSDHLIANTEINVPSIWWWFRCKWCMCSTKNDSIHKLQVKRQHFNRTYQLFWCVGCWFKV